MPRAQCTSLPRPTLESGTYVLFNCITQHITCRKHGNCRSDMVFIQVRSRGVVDYKLQGKTRTKIKKICVKTRHRWRTAPGTTELLPSISHKAINLTTICNMCAICCYSEINTTAVTEASKTKGTIVINQAIDQPTNTHQYTSIHQ